MDKEDIAFMSELEAAAHLRPSRSSQFFLFAVAGLFVWLFVWAATSQVDERVRGSGQVMPSSDIQVVQSLDGGIVSDLDVTEGQHVKKGQVLLRIDDVQFATQGRGIEAQMAGLKAKRARLQAQVSGKPFSLDDDFVKKYPDIAANEQKLYLSQQQELKTAVAIVEDQVHEAEANLAQVRANISQFSKSKALLQKELDITRKLVAKKAQPEIEQIRLERQYNDVAGNLSAAYQSQQSLEAKLSAARKQEDQKRGDFRSQALADLNDTETRIAAIRESLKSVEDKVSRSELKSPVDGIVQKTYVKTVGGVVQPAQRLVEIVPTANDLMIRARVSPSDVAFLKPGQKVRVSITAYESQIYGTLTGKLERISPDTATDQRGDTFFEIDVRTDKNYLGDAAHPLPIAPGMVAETEVIVGKRTILTYLLKPVLRTKDRAFTEK
ncbi:MAG: HlyD family type I secretion periplasmic adaptor subunit [Alphaproteobacteria bacterium]|nr:HlyD family type I secretion periplasmic adaptor subunit [Alphaproteobacteria bacterium]